ncbi:SpoIIE family protein phosphatase [Desulfocurvus sp. DL9XJH121]
MPKVDRHLIKRAMTGLDNECGDTGLIAVNGDTCLAALVDVLGHGPEAHEVALLAEDFLAGHADLPLPELMRGLHAHLQGSRGCVAALCRLDTASARMHFIGIGNIVCRIFGTENRRLLSRDGIVGYMASPPRETAVQLFFNDVVLLHTDGISGHFHPHECPGLLTGSAREIAGRVMESFGKQDDDASCLVMRYEA